MPIFKIDGYDIDAASYQEAGDMLDQARREITAESVQRQEDASGPVAALAAMQERVGGLLDRADAADERLDVVSDAVVVVADRATALEAAVDAIPRPQLAQMNELAAQVMTEGARAVNKAVEASAQIEAQTVQMLSQVAELQQQVTTISANADDTVATIERGAEQVVNKQVQRSKAAVQDIIESLVEPVGIASVEQEKPEAFTITLTNGTVHEIKLPQGPRGYRGAQGKSQAVGGGSGAGAQLAGALVDQEIRVSGVDTELKFQYLNLPIDIRGDLVATFKLTLLSNRNIFRTFTLWVSAPDVGALAEAEHTEAGEFSSGGFSALVDYTWIIHRLPGGELRLQMRLNSNTPIRVQGGIASVTSHL